MTEREKAQQGLGYMPWDSTLTMERNRAYDLCYEYNHLRPSLEAERHRILKELLGDIDESTTIVAPFHCDYGYNIKLGKNFYANTGCVMLDCATIHIGDNVLLGPHVGLYTATHPIDANERKTGLEYAQAINIGDNVWLGAGVHVLPGVTIGSNTVIGAGSVVSKDIPAGVLAVGNPCRVIRHLDSNEQASR